MRQTALRTTIMLATTAYAAAALPLAAQADRDTMLMPAPEVAMVEKSAGSRPQSTGRVDTSIAALTAETMLHGPENYDFAHSDFNLPAGRPTNLTPQSSFRIDVETSGGPRETVELDREVEVGLSGDFEMFRPRQSVSIRF